MKTKMIFSLLLLASTSFLRGQDVMSADKVMSKGVQVAASIDIYDVDERQVEQWWRNFMKQYTKSIKKDRKSKEWFADDATISAISPSTPIDLYTTIESTGKYVTVSTWADGGTGFINPADNPESFQALESMMSSFAHEAEVEKINIELNSEEDALSKLEKDLKQLQSRNEGYYKDIEAAKARIAKAEEDIRQNVKEQESKQSEIESQRQKIESVKRKLDDTKKGS
ncbi:MAG TPA: hypothetical protein P5275_13250 [Saprospiraceae bacterium]|nr:hypothetical protein [Saprospiraceae bacterium]MCB9270765.1 hypothetical protein [Lewinellaceae bacterium]HPG05865.1 hypothetical protein [Saprospiraceae bacterium]HPQ99487.1 hypothetical protein [Saprospiraceae bacterium]HRV85830.1 hypothetical protein [Saprospiraceae bacterium]